MLLLPFFLQGLQGLRASAVKPKPQLRVCDLHVYITCTQSVDFDKFAPWLYLVAHEHGKYAVGFNRIINAHAQQAAGGGVSIF